MTNDRPWRLADLIFVPLGDGKERAAINGDVEIVRQNGRFWGCEILGNARKPMNNARTNTCDVD